MPNQLEIKLVAKLGLFFYILFRLTISVFVLNPHPCPWLCSEVPGAGTALINSILAAGADDTSQRPDKDKWRLRGNETLEEMREKYEILRKDHARYAQHRIPALSLF
jgi:hypothetical protein